MLGSSKLDKILPRILKKGDEEGKELAQKIFQNAAIISKQKYTDGKPLHFQAGKDKDGKHNASIKPSVDNARVTNNVSRLRKSRGLDILSGQPVKEATDIGHALIGASSAKSAGPFAKRPQVKPELKSVSKSAPTTTTLNQKKANHISAKPSSFFSSLQSASKKPGTSNAALSAKSKDGKDK